MEFTIETEQENDSRWIAEVIELPGILKYGATREEAIAQAEALALRVVADRIEHGEQPAGGSHSRRSLPIVMKTQPRRLSVAVREPCFDT